jgi:lipopolysaccharide transport system permease protein
MSTPSVIHRPPSLRVELRLGELLRYRELIFFLAQRDVKLRYRQAALGVAWAVLQPLITMAIFSLIFGRWASMPSEGTSYSLFVFAALLPWQLFAYALAFASQSVLSNQNLVTKVYFPRVVLPVASVLGGLVDFGSALLVFLVLMLCMGYAPGLRVLSLPLFLAMAMAAALGVALWLSALIVRFRDVKYTLPFLTQVWMLASPVFYPPSDPRFVPERWRWAYDLNPLAGVIEGFRYSLLGTSGLTPGLLASSAASCLVLLFSGTVYFRRTEIHFADRI